MIQLASDAITYVLPVLITAIVGLLAGKHGKGEKGSAGDTGSHGGAESSQPSTAEHWQQLVDQMNSFTGIQIKELKRLLKVSNERVDRLEKRVSVLESKYRAALDFIRTLIRRHPDSSADIPAEIRHDL